MRIADFERLHAYLFDNYDPTIPPFRSASNDTVEVAFGIAPIYLDFDDYGVLRGRVWERLVFNDHRLTWDKEKFGGISVIRVDPSKIWMPDIVLYNKYVRPSNTYVHYAVQLTSIFQV